MGADFGVFPYKFTALGAALFVLHRRFFMVMNYIIVTSKNREILIVVYF